MPDSTQSARERRRLRRFSERERAALRAWMASLDLTTYTRDDVKMIRSVLAAADAAQESA